MSMEASLTARLDRLPASRIIWKIVVLLSLGFFFELYDLILAGYIAPGLVAAGILAKKTQGLFSANSVASFIAALFCGLFVGTVACGFLADRYGRRTIFTYSLLWYSTCAVLLAIQTTAPGLNLCQFLAGIGLGVEMVTIGAYLSELAPAKIRGRAFACCQAVGFSAVPVVAFLAFLLVPRVPLGVEGWRWVVLIGATGAIFVWWIRRALPESPRWLVQHGRLDEAERVISLLESRVRAELGHELPAPACAEPIIQPGKFREMWVPPYRNRTLMLVVFNIFQTIGFYGFANWVPSMLIAEGITVTTSLQYTFVIALAAPLGPILGLFIADRFERKSVIVASAFAVSVCGILFSVVRSATPLILAGILVTLLGNTISYTYHAYQAELFPTRIRATAVGFVYSWSRFSAILNAFVIAFVLARGGVFAVFLFIAAAYGVVMLVIGLFGPRTRGLSLERVSR
jgi:putative MFS transporter